MSFPLAFILTRFTNLDLPLVFTFIQAADLLKVAVGLLLVNRKVWVHNLVMPGNA
jgi:Na+-driven multidrug efflux pump